MTAIAIWYTNEIPQNPGLWIAADTLVSGSSREKLIDDAVKIFGLPVVCRRPGERGRFTEIYYAHTYGYCFSGSTLCGQNSYLGMLPLLENLISTNAYIPSLNDVANFVYSYLCRAFDDFKNRVGPQAKFEAALFGYCRITHSLSVYHYIPRLDDVGECTMTCDAHMKMKLGNFIYLGDYKSRLREKLLSVFKDETCTGSALSVRPRTL